MKRFLESVRRIHWLGLLGLLMGLIMANPCANGKPVPTTNRDLVRIRLQDNQPAGQPGHGVASVGDAILVELTTADRCKAVVYHFFDARSKKPIVINGRTDFPTPYDPDRSGRSWTLVVPITENSQPDFKTGPAVPGKAAGVQVTAEVKDESHTRIVTADLPFELDLTIGRKSASMPAGQNTDLLQEGKTLLESDFNTGPDPRWSIVAGDRWVYLKNRFGDLSDSAGPDQLGNWAVAGDEKWTDYALSADVAETLDGLGIFALAVRFQNPRNYYSFEWVREETAGDMLRLVRCRDGQRFEIAKVTGVTIDKFPFRLGLRASGDYLSGTLNGKPMLSGYAGDFTAGPVAVGAIDRQVLVDNVKVVRIVSPGKRSRFFSDLKVTYAMEPQYFLRDAGVVELPIEISNTGPKPFENIHLQIAFDRFILSAAGDVLAADEAGADTSSGLLPPRVMDIPRLDPGRSLTIQFPLDTRLIKQGEYILKIRSTLLREKLVRDEVVPIGIARNWNPERFNYFAWGLPNDEAGLKDYAEHGHTMGFAGEGRGTELDWRHHGNPVPEADQLKTSGQVKNPARFSPFDYCLKYGLIGGVNLQSISGAFFPDTLYGRSKTNVPTALQPYQPAIRDYSINFARTCARRYSAYPACRIFNINSETEYQLQPDFSKLGLARVQKLFGGPPPEGCLDSSGIPGSQVPGLIDKGIVNDDHPVARFYRWFWLEGEGYNVLARDMAQAVREVNPDMLVLHDPAERMPFVRDRHDGLNPWDWTYTAPSPMSLAYKIEVLRALAKPPYDKICNYVQVLWKAKVVSPQDECPSAAVIRLGLLYSTSRPIYAAGHWNTDWMRSRSHLDRWEAVKDLHETFWKPLGPVLTSLKTDAPREVAFLVSSNNQWFRYKNRGSLWTWEYAYAAWHEAFLRAGLPVDILFEESAAEGKLDRYKAVFIPFGELIGRKAYTKLVAYAQNGGHVFADRYLGYEVPGVTRLKTDLSSLDYDQWAWTTPNRLSAGNRMKILDSAAGEIAAVFADYRATLAASDDTRLIVNTRLWEGTPYIFAINNHRSAGTQVGQYGVMWENGEPLTASITLPAQQGSPFVYDLVEHTRVPTVRTPQGLRWTRQYAPASGVLFAVLFREIASLELTVPDQPVTTGNAFTVSARLLDTAKRPMGGRLPLRLTIRDGQGSVSEYSDVFAFTNGRFEKSGIIALNDTAGAWSVRVDDLASGRSFTKYLQVKPAQK